MSPRPKNPPPDRRTEILTAALEVFAARGYAAATNAEIARAAGVTPAALYYYFPSKADLFRAAVTERREQILPHLANPEAGLLELPPALVLPQLVTLFRTFLGDPKTQLLLKVILSEGPRSPELVQIWTEQAVGPGIQLVTSYLRHQMEAGKLKPLDPRVMLLLVQGPLIMTLIMKEFLALPGLAGVELDAVGDAILNHVLPSLLAEKE
jgi:AcrR family transcriptional regulator